MSITIYSKSGCPYCEKIKKVAEYLNETKNYSYKVYELDEDFTREQFYAEFKNGSTFPQVLLGDKHLGGCTDAVKYFQENNIL
jgi:glutaredoxin 3